MKTEASHEEFIKVLEDAELFYTHDHPEAESCPPWLYAAPHKKVVQRFLERHPDKLLPPAYKCAHEWEVLEGYDADIVYQCLNCKKSVRSLPTHVKREGTREAPVGAQDPGYYVFWWDVLGQCRQSRPDLCRGPGRPPKSQKGGEA